VIIKEVFSMTYMNINPYKLKNEKELHSLIKENLAKLNLTLIKYEYKYESDIPDFLCVDEDGKLTVIEVKLGIDKNIILQAMRYYKMVDKYKYLIAKEVPEIKVNEEVYLILIAEDYDNDTKNVVEFLDINLNLYTYTAIINEDTGTSGLLLNEVIILPSEPLQYVKIPQIEDHLNKFSSADLKKTYNDILEQIRKLAPGVDIYPLQKYLGLKYKGRNVATIHTRKKFFWFISFKHDENGKYVEKAFVKVYTGKEEEINDVYETIQKLIKMVDE